MYDIIYRLGFTGKCINLGLNCSQYRILYIIYKWCYLFFGGILFYFPVTFVSLSIKKSRKNEKYILKISYAFRLNVNTRTTCVFRSSQLYMYTFFLAVVDGHWAHWSQFTLCSATCGTGSMVRTRVCDNPPPQFGGKDCEGTPYQEKRCKNKNCPSKEVTRETMIFSCIVLTKQEN